MVGKTSAHGIEWEIAARGASPIANDLSSGALRPLPAPSGSVDAPRQMSGDVWEWTSSAYLPYPRLSCAEGRNRRIQRQVYGGSAGAARRLLRDAERDVLARPTAISFIRISAGNSWACDWRRTDDAAAIDASRGAARCAKRFRAMHSGRIVAAAQESALPIFVQAPAAARFREHHASY